MSISYEAVLEKIEIELTKAKEAKGEIYPHLYAIKTLAEVILEQDHPKALTKQEPNRPRAVKMDTIPAIQPISSSKPLKTEDGANGDSIFDF